MSVDVIEEERRNFYTARSKEKVQHGRQLGHQLPDDAGEARLLLGGVVEGGGVARLD